MDHDAKFYEGGVDGASALKPLASALDFMTGEESVPCSGYRRHSLERSRLLSLSSLRMVVDGYRLERGGCQGCGKGRTELKRSSRFKRTDRLAMRFASSG